VSVRDKSTEWLRVRLYRQMSPEDRILTAARMFEDAVEIVRSSILDRSPDIDPAELERQVRHRVLPRGLVDPAENLREASQSD
jgi:hypothetical protein